MPLKLKKVAVTSFFSLLFCFNSVFAEQTKNVVKVGYYTDMPYLMSSLEDGSGKRGYGYEYLRMIANYTDWEYEYVYGNWNTLYAKFINGEIDLLEDISYTEDRAKKYMLFPEYAMGTEVYRLYTNPKSNNTPISIDELKESLKGKKIGITSNTIQYDIFLEWMKVHDYECIPVGYEYDEDRNNDLAAGKIDAALEIEASALREWEPIIVVGSTDYYLAVTNKRPDLLEQLNSALLKIQTVSPNFSTNLYYKYYSSAIVSSRLSDVEKEWCKDHPVVRCGLLKDTVFNYTDSKGMEKNIIPEVLNEMAQKLGLDGSNIEYVLYDSYESMRTELIDRKIDIAFPMHNNPYISEKYGYTNVCSIDTVAITSIQREEIDLDYAKDIAVLSASICFDYVKFNFPNARIHVCNSAEEAIKLLKKGTVDSYIATRQRAEECFNTHMCRGLISTQLFKPMDVSIGIRSGQPGLYMLITRASSLLDSDFINHTLAKNTLVLSDYSLKDFLLSFFWILILIALVFFTIVAFLFMSIRSRKHEEKQRIALEEERQKAELASKAKSLFIFNISHDIRTPMNAIIGYTELLRRNRNDSEKFDQYINNIQISSVYLQDLINNVLETARIESGKAVLDETVIAGEEFINSVLVIFDEEFNSKNLTFTKNIIIKHPHIYGDSTKLKQIYLNILSNAIKYTPAGGSITFTLTEEKCDRKGYTYVKAVVEDTGIGMSKEFLPHIFDDFARERTSTESKIIGTGLGMGITKKIIDLMDGSIDIQSEPGVGTRVTIYVPHRIADVPEAPVDVGSKKIASGDSTYFKGRRILLAEDNDLNAGIAIEILKAEGFEIDRACDGIECVAMLDRADDDYYDVILMDIQMPNMDGYKATKVIRLLPSQKKATIPIIAMTANAFDEDKRNAILAGMNAHIAKPINIKDLMDTLRSALD